MKAVFFQLLLLLVLYPSINLFSQTYPPLTGPVIDPNSYLSAQAKQEFETKLLKHQNQTTNQVVVYITPKLQQPSIEEESTKVFAEWKLGLKGKDNGVLLIIAPNERKLRIEVGYGLEYLLTDLDSAKILQDFIIPELKKDQWTEAVRVGVDAILAKLENEIGEEALKNCPDPVSDPDRLLDLSAKATIRKELERFSKKQKSSVRFCVKDFGESEKFFQTCNSLFYAITAKQKATPVFLINHRETYSGCIALDPKEYIWKFSFQKRSQIFESVKSYGDQKDIGSFAKLSFPKFLQEYSALEKMQPIQNLEGSILDPNHFLMDWSQKRILETITKLEKEFGIVAKLIFAPTKKDVLEEVETYHKKWSKGTKDITVFFAINQQTFAVKATTISEIPNIKHLVDRMHDSITNHNSYADLDWAVIYAIETIYQEVKKQDDSLQLANQPQKDKEAFSVPISLVSSASILVAFFSFFLGSLLVFLTAVFSFLGVALFLKSIPFAGSSILLAILAILFCAFVISYALYWILKKIGFAKAFEKFMEDFTTSSSSDGSSYGSSSSSYSGSSGSSSRSSYSGGGGSSGGGGASGSF